MRSRQPHPTCPATTAAGLMIVAVLTACDIAWAARLPSIAIHPTEITAWRALLLDTDGDGQEELLCAGYGGELVCQSAVHGTVRWRKSVEGFPFCLKSVDLDRDGKDEILASSSSLHLYAFRANGEMLWRVRTPFPVLSFDVSAGATEEATRIWAAGNGPDLLVLNGRGSQLNSVHVSGRESTVAVLVGGMKRGASPGILLMNQYGRFGMRDSSGQEGLWTGGEYSKALRWGKAVALWDADDDGQLEVFYTRSQRTYKRGAFLYTLHLYLVDSDGAELWHQSLSLGSKVSLTYVDAHASLIDYTGDGCEEAVVLLGSMLCVVDTKGKVLYLGCCRKGMAFTHMTASPKKDRLILGSIAGASDKSVYVVRFETQETDAFAQLTPDHGSYRQIMDNVRGIHRLVLAAKPRPDAPERQYRIDASGRGTITPERLRELFPYKNIHFVGNFGGGDDPAKVAERFVSSGIDHLTMASHGIKRGNRATHWPSPEDLPKYFEMAKGRCRGISFAETSQFMMPQLREMSLAYLQEFMLPCMRIAAEHNKDIYLWEKQAWWASIPACRAFRPIFDRRFWPHLVARTEESNSRCPELNLMARVGLYRTGIVRAWSCNVIRDLWRTLSTLILEYDYSDPSGLLRQLVAYAAAGASDFRLQYEFGAKDKDGVYNLDGRRDMDLVLETFVRMLGKGLLIPPKPEEISGLSPVVIRMHEPHTGLMRNTDGNVEDFKPNAEARNGLLTGYWWWALCRCHPAFFSSYALGVKHYGHDFIPETPYGMPVVVPQWTPEDRLGWATDFVDTDGVHVIENGRKYTASERKSDILRRLREGSDHLTFRAEGVYCMGRKQSENSYRIVLVDPGVFAPAPAERSVDLRVHPKHSIASVTDVLTGKRMEPVTRNSISVHVPAGAFRIVDITF